MAGSSAKQQALLTDADYIILGLICCLWSALFGMLYYFAPNVWIVVIGASCAVTTLSSYVRIGGIRAFEAALNHDSGETFGYGRVKSSI